MYQKFWDPSIGLFARWSREKWSVIATNPRYLSLTKGWCGLYPSVLRDVTHPFRTIALNGALHCPFGYCSSLVHSLHCHHVLCACVEIAFLGSDIVTRQLFWAVQKANHSINISNIAQLCHWQKIARESWKRKGFHCVMWKGVFIHQDNCPGMKSGSNKGQWSTRGHCFYHKVISQDQFYRPFTGPRLAI